MPRGLPASYIKRAKKELGKGASFSRIFKRAWQLYKGSKVYRALKGNPRSKKSKSKKGGSKKVPKKSKRRSRRSFTIPLAPVIGFVPMFAEAVQRAIDGNWDGVLKSLQWNVLGLNPENNNWNFNKFIQNITPPIIGLLIHKFVGGSPLNLNAILARHRVPLIRI